MEKRWIKLRWRRGGLKEGGGGKDRIEEFGERRREGRRRRVGGEDGLGRGKRGEGVELK